MTNKNLKPEERQVIAAMRSGKGGLHKAIEVLNGLDLVLKESRKRRQVTAEELERCCHRARTLAAQIIKDSIDFTGDDWDELMEDTTARNGVHLDDLSEKSQVKLVAQIELAATEVLQQASRLLEEGL